MGLKKQYASLDRMILAGIYYKEGKAQKAASLLAEAMDDPEAEDMLDDLNEANSEADDNMNDDSEVMSRVLAANIAKRKKAQGKNDEKATDLDDANTDMDDGQEENADVDTDMSGEDIDMSDTPNEENARIRRLANAKVLAAKAKK